MHVSSHRVMAFWKKQRQEHVELAGKQDRPDTGSHDGLQLFCQRMITLKYDG